MKLLSIGIAALGLALTAVTSQASIQIGFSSTTGSVITFNGSSFSFAGGTSEFKVTTSTDPNAIDLTGYFVNPVGGWQIGTITPSGSDQSASVTGLGQLKINDGTEWLVADVTWVSIKSSGTSGNVNVQGLVNLSNITYSGSNSALQELAHDSAITTLSYTFIPGKTLQTLVGINGPYSTPSFSGVISATAVPEPATIVAGALLLLPFGAGVFRSIRKNR